MPGIFPSYDPNDKTINEAGENENKARAGLIETYWKYYNGEHKRPLKVKAGKADDNIIINLSGQSIDKAVGFFAPKSPVFEIPGGVDRVPASNGELVDQRSKMQQSLDAFWMRNDLDSLVTDLGLSGFIAGHVFLRLLPPEPGEDGTMIPRVALLDPQKIIAYWDVNDIRRVLYYRQTWITKEGGNDVEHRQDILPVWLYKGQVEPVTGRAIINKPEDQFWMIVEWMKGKSGRWEKVGEDPWNWPFAPVVSWKNKHNPHQFYGPSDLKDADLNDGVNFIASNTGRIIKFHAHARTIGLGMDAADVVPSTSIDEFFTVNKLPSEANIYNLEMQSDLASSLNYYNLLRSAFFTQMHVVDLSSQQDKLGQITNFGVRMLFSDQISANDNKHRLYGPGLAEAARRGLIMMGHADAVTPNVTWADPLPQNRKELVDSVKVESEIGATSQQTLLETLGRDPAKESQNKAEEKSDNKQALGDMLAAMGDRGGFGTGGLFPGVRTNQTTRPM